MATGLNRAFFLAKMTKITSPPSSDDLLINIGLVASPPPFQVTDPQQLQANQVYYSVTYPTVGAALDALLYVAPAITSFSLSVGTVEIGSTITGFTATWGVNKTMTTASLTGATIQPGDTSHVFSGLNLTSNATYTLTVGDGQNQASASRSITFSHKRYWGVSDKTALTDTDILALSSEFSSSKSKSVIYNCTGGKYPYFCYPGAWGAPASVTVGGLAFSDYTVTAQNFTNASGHTDSFNVVRFNGIQNGDSITVGWS